jgi:hypothetical protein
MPMGESLAWFARFCLAYLSLNLCSQDTFAVSFMRAHLAIAQIRP